MMSPDKNHIAFLHAELDQFQLLFKKLSGKYGGSAINDHIYVLGPKNENENYDLTFACLIHGNELGGLKAVNCFLMSLIESNETIDKTLCIIIGNIKAAALNRRFYERDLNRCFGSFSLTYYEDVLAKLIEPHLAASRFLVDLHQTNTPTESDFYIFPCTQENIKFAKSLSDTTPIVVHEKDFSEDGMCSDTFVTKCGGVGITYEMGMVGKDKEQILKTENILYEAYLLKIKNKHLHIYLPSEIYTWSEVILSSPDRHLIPGFYNFSQVQAGNILGNDSSGAIYVKKSGYVLFPKYGESSLSTSELCRVICSYKIETLLPISDLSEPISQL